MLGELEVMASVMTQVPFEAGTASPVAEMDDAPGAAVIVPALPQPLEVVIAGLAAMVTWLSSASEKARPDRALGVGLVMVMVSVVSEPCTSALPPLPLPSPLLVGMACLTVSEGVATTMSLAAVLLLITVLLGSCPLTAPTLRTLL